jgi:nitrogen fixation NifU-like protein
MIDELYHDLILDHGRRPRNFGRIDAPCNVADGFNPLCGDKLRVYLRLDGDRIAEAKFEGAGCAISTASASVMTEALEGKSRAEAEALFQRFHRLLTTGNGADRAVGMKAAAVGDETESDAIEDDEPETDKLLAFAGVRQFPIRVKCATLAWHAMRAALREGAGTVSTE